MKFQSNTHNHVCGNNSDDDNSGNLQFAVAFDKTTKNTTNKNKKCTKGTQKMTEFFINQDKANIEANDNNKLVVKTFILIYLFYYLL